MRITKATAAATAFAFLHACTPSLCSLQSVARGGRRIDDAIFSVRQARYQCRQHSNKHPSDGCRQTRRTDSPLLPSTHLPPCPHIKQLSACYLQSVARGGRKIDDAIIPVVMTLSAQTSANATQDAIDAKCEKRRKGVFGPPGGKRFIVHVDDLNMPKVRESPGELELTPPSEWHVHVCMNYCLTPLQWRMRTRMTLRWHDVFQPQLEPHAIA